MGAACLASTQRGLFGSNTSPMASAPACAAAKASSMRVMPQIFIRVRMMAPEARELTRGPYPRKSRDFVLLGVLDIGKVKSIGRRGHATLRAVARFKYLFRPTGFALAGTVSISTPAMLRTMCCRKALA